MSRSGKFIDNKVNLTFQLRASRRRKSVGLTVTDTGELLVHAPQSLSLAAIQEVIHKNLAWIVKKQAERREAWGRLEPGKVYYRGQALTLALTDSGPPGVVLSDGVLHLHLAPRTRDPWRHLLTWYQEEARAILAARVRHYAAAMGLTVPSLELRNWRRRWGECHPEGHLRFNWRLVLLPPDILDYLVVHELAHFIVPGHPPRFWREVEKYLGDFAARRRWLRVYGSPFLVWQWEAAAA